MKVARIKTRQTWGFNPVPRRVPSKQVYNQLDSKLELQKKF